MNIKQGTRSSADQAHVNLKRSREAEPQVMQILTLYRDTVIEHHQRSARHRGPFTVGFGVGADCVVADEQLPTGEAYPLAEVTRAGHLHINIPERVDGEVLLDHQLYQISALRAAGRLGAHPTLNSDTLRLPPRARCRLSVGEVTFVISSLPDPGELPRRAFLDQIGHATLRSLGGVVALLATLWVLFCLTPQAPADLSINHMSAVERYVTIDVESVEDVVKPTPHERDERGDSTRDNPTAPTRPHHETQGPSAPETSSDPVTTAQRRVRAEEAVGQILGGMSAFMSEDAVNRDALSHFTGVGERGADARGHLSMGGIKHTSGQRGDAMNLTHSVKVSTRAKRSAGVITCLTSMRRCSRGARRPTVKPLTPQVERGALPRSVVRRVILSRIGAYQNCYERELQRTRSLRGGLELSIKINPQGRVSLAKVSKTDLKSPSVERCVLTHVRALNFPPSPRLTIVRYPLRFESR